MNLTASALSHQLKMLETQLNVKLFTRNGRGLTFTKAGKDLHVEVDACLTRLGAAINNITRDLSGSTLVVNALPTFAMRWLLPRFASFEKDYARLDIRVSTQPLDFERDAIDCAIYSGRPGRAGLNSEFLRDETLIVVCAPSLITRAKPLNRPADLIYHPLLHVRSRLDAKDKLEDWDLWLQAVGTPERGHHGVVLENRNFLIQAAKAGHGVAVVDPLMVQDELKSGQLIQPLTAIAKSNCAYYLAYPSNVPASEKVLAFRNWLVEALQREGPL
jgi:LysR family glycine cleavage system transcriptional activator